MFRVERAFLGEPISGLGPRLGFFQDVLEGTANAPWLWWGVALVVIVVLILLGMRLLGLFPD